MFGSKRAKPVEFTRDHLPIVQGFTCGTEEWSFQAADWIKSAPPYRGALWSMTKWGNSVWLYMLDDEVVGYASLGATRWPDPPPPERKREILYIPMMAVASQFQGKPDAPPRYSEQIITHIIDEAQQRDNDCLGLLVDTENEKAIRLYERVGFTKGIEAYEAHNRLFWRMYLSL